MNHSCAWCFFLASWKGCGKIPGVLCDIKRPPSHHSHVPLFLFVACLLMFAHLPTSKSKQGRQEMVQRQPVTPLVPPNTEEAPVTGKMIKTSFLSCACVCVCVRCVWCLGWRGGVVRQAADFSSWWKEVRLSGFKELGGGRGCGAHPNIYPTVQMSRTSARMWIQEHLSHPDAPKTEVGWKM